jgi:hypothetical protein
MEHIRDIALVAGALIVPGMIILKWRRFGFFVGALLFPLLLYPVVEVQFARRPILSEFWPVVVFGGGFTYALLVLALRSGVRFLMRRFSSDHSKAV